MIGAPTRIPSWRGVIIAVTAFAVLAAVGLLIRASQPPAVPPAPGAAGVLSTPGPSGRAAVAIPSDTRTTFVPTASVPSGATVCPAPGTPRAAAANGRTSCPLAVSVRDAWTARGASIGQAVTIEVTDALSGEPLTIRCLGRPPVVCVGPQDRLVYLY